eukprot:1143927-Amphidinium_carterae.1
MALFDCSTSIRNLLQRRLPAMPGAVSHCSDLHGKLRTCLMVPSAILLLQLGILSDAMKSDARHAQFTNQSISPLPMLRWQCTPYTSLS